MSGQVDAKKLTRSLPTLLINPSLDPWGRLVERERNDYRRAQFKKRNPQLEQEKFKKILDAVEDYKKTMSKYWKNQLL